MQTLTTFDPPVNHLAEQAARADRSINPNPAAAPCWSVWWTPDCPGNVRVVRLSTSRPDGRWRSVLLADTPRREDSRTPP